MPIIKKVSDFLNLIGSTASLLVRNKGLFSDEVRGVISGLSDDGRYLMMRDEKNGKNVTSILIDSIEIVEILSK